MEDQLLPTEANCDRLKPTNCDNRRREEDEQKIKQTRTKMLMTKTTTTATTTTIEQRIRKRARRRLMSEKEETKHGINLCPTRLIRKSERSSPISISAAKKRASCSSVYCCVFMRPKSPSNVLLLVVVCSLFLLFSSFKLELANCAKLPDIYWNSSNPIFRIDNTDHIFDVNKKQHDHDQVDLICPNASGSNGQNNATTANSEQQHNQPTPMERYIIYSVSKEEYDTCRLDKPNPRVVAVCDQQQQAGKGRPASTPFTITFRPFSPQPNGLEFIAGQDYYLISALVGHQSDPVRRFSPCREQNMKVIFKVCCKSSSSAGATPTSSLQQQRPNASLLPNANRDRTPAHSTRKPGGVMTLKPSLQFNSKSKQNVGLEDYLRSLGPSSVHQHQQQQQPITVLPIEVLQPSTSEATPTSPAPSSSAQQEPAVESERNDIVQNETAPSPAASTIASFFRQPAPVVVPARLPYQQQQPPQPFFRFDPTAAPEILSQYQRYAPTPLPPNLTNGNKQPLNGNNSPFMNRPPQQFQQQQQQQQQQRQLVIQPQLNHAHLQSAQNSRPQQQQQSSLQPHSPLPRQSRISFYPPTVWSTYDSMNPASRDLITVQDQQTASSSAAQTNCSLNPFLMALAVLLLQFALTTLNRPTQKMYTSMATR